MTNDPCDDRKHTNVYVTPGTAPQTVTFVFTRLCGDIVICRLNKADGSTEDQKVYAYGSNRCTFAKCAPGETFDMYCPAADNDSCSYVVTATPA